MNKREILEEAARIVTGDRQNDYGEVENNFQTIADMWIAYLGGDVNISWRDVAVMMILVKAARIRSGHHKDDNWVDIAGYAACGGEHTEPTPIQRFWQGELMKQIEQSGKHIKIMRGEQNEQCDADR